jgi:hypothetical protein
MVRFGSAQVLDSDWRIESVAAVHRAMPNRVLRSKTSLEAKTGFNSNTEGL